MGTVICPFATREFEKIKENHSTLASTGCTRDFCQSGRIIHTDEPRIGENRTISSVEHDAEGFLRELLKDGFFSSERVFQERLEHVLYEIRGSAVEGIIRETKEVGLIGGNWTQTPEEIEFGIRRAWRNARKCIMRSHCEDLKLCDLRNVTSSTKMAVELMKALSKAYNDGNILPTVFVFPPRTPNNRGPMVWNDQLLTFAAYELEDGSILGDPKNAQFTKDVIELGWVPPKNKTRFDLLPVVVMAEGDLPVIIELPTHLRKLIEIRHPEYPGLDELGLKWAAFPALSRLGFDIGGVQYTATPFIGWFMEAEIGTRNLADTFRYNVLPDVVKALHLADDVLAEVDSFDDLPEYEKLALLSRAQTELNYAVQHSYIREKITMSDSLTASIKFSRYDDEFQKKHGYRLPSDPFWVAPPQGSIVPLWHRGAAPNYQPKPMICRHVQEPAKAWKRERSNWPIGSTAAKILVDGATGYRAQLGESQVEDKSITSNVEPPPVATIDSASGGDRLIPKIPSPPKEPEVMTQQPPTTDDRTLTDVTISRSKPAPPIRSYPIIKKSTAQNTSREMFSGSSVQGSPSVLSPISLPKTLDSIAQPSAMPNVRNGSRPSTPGLQAKTSIATTPYGSPSRVPLPSTPSFSLGLGQISTPTKVVSPSETVNNSHNPIGIKPRINSPTFAKSSARADPFNTSSYALPSWVPRTDSTSEPSRSLNSYNNAMTTSPEPQKKAPVTPGADIVNAVVPKELATQSIPAPVFTVPSSTTSQSVASNNSRGNIFTSSYSMPINGQHGATFGGSDKTPTKVVTATPTPKPTPKTEPPNKVEVSKQAELPKKVEVPKPVELPKKMETPKQVEPVKKVEVPRQVEAPKKVEPPKPIELPKKVEPVTQAPKEAPGERKSGDKGTPASVAIYYCSAGTIAEKLATKLRDKTKTLAKTSPHISLDADVHPLDDLEASEMTADKVFLFVISTTGTGETPANGTDFSEMCDEIIETGHFEGSKGFRFAIFGNGDSRYTTTFNFAATKVNDQLKKIGGVSLIGNFYEADTAVQSPPWSALNKFWAQVQEKIS